ncbi:predicted protein [Thalassiosira pseudonana CCMP1335]|uniref:Uncharacterized protein n=1 Tax=Thalassiosira pseudonana TaxID=35128 RepID=B5YN45_THAPS|nr:predicted protein [Thalassiosira pseudonana CCMP1335]ACI64918.1 predicted protein [Thalassiosira pseudonana CCMP1335]|eukprot:g6654.t1 g6654   contig23:964113-965776(+)
MRLLLPSATIAVVSGTAAVSASETSETFVTSNVVQDVDFAYNASRPRSIKLVSLGEECNNFVSEKNRVPDVGVLGCRGEKQTCVEDYTSSIGGRCAIDRSLLTPKADTVEANPSLPAFSRRRRTQQTAVSDRLLQSSDWICPTNCPKEFCRCAEKYSEVKDCAKEMNDICVDKTVDSCVPDAYLPFYYDTYCPFSECIINNRGYENCSCEYYRNYCTLYYSYEESTSKCEIASCCDLKNSPEDKRECLPAMQPTGSPTMFPTVTSMPSDSPTISSEPTTSPKPTVSPAPSSAPTVSSAPTISSAPTSVPSSSPSASPTVSPMPTHPLPTSTPSDAPSVSPSVSSAPTISAMPSAFPTVSNSPTFSVSPTSSPSISTAPSEHPSTSPSISPAPTSTPSTSPPTVAPTEKPTDRPSKLPTPSPSMAPQDAITTFEPTNNRSSSSSAVRTTITTLFVGIGGALWFFAW